MGQGTGSGDWVRGSLTQMDVALARAILTLGAKQESRRGEDDGGDGPDGAETALLARLTALGERLMRAPDADALRLADEALLARFIGHPATVPGGGDA